MNVATLSYDHLIPKAWRRRVGHRISVVNGSLLHLIIDRRTGAQLAAVALDNDAPEAQDCTWVMADGNMVTRWATLEDAIHDGARPREGRALWMQRMRHWFGGESAFPSDAPGFIEEIGDGWDELEASVVWAPGEQPCPECEPSDPDPECSTCNGYGSTW